jgi:glucose-6-phosphate-specific signal transduction histidine kinase
LAGIKERIAMLGGVSRVTSAKGKGTRIEISVPAGEAAQVVERPLAQAAHAAQRPN